ncbi:MAG: class I SAM-dependent methyltransferase [Ignavibacteriaceae bacterium]|nr:class I SAM-dependent methyltransferase [Ignavibacteriaceae bacterium]
MNTDHQWERFGKIDPYYGVLTQDEYHKDKLNKESKEKFFNTGDNYVKYIFNNIYKQFIPDFKPKCSLDYGCGVGRVVIPLSKYSKLVNGVDISRSMLNLCEANCKEYNINNFQLSKADGELITQKYDFIHSIDVFQHIPVKKGEKIFRNLVKHLEPDGIGLIHFTYAKKNTMRTFIEFIRDKIPFMSNLFNLIKGRNFFYPVMQMNSYSLNNLFLILQNSGIKKTYCEFSEHRNDLGIAIYFQKSS